MAKYLVLKKQHGEGCDYTIGCGMQYEVKEFDGSFEDAIKHFFLEIAFPIGHSEANGFNACCRLDPEDDQQIEEIVIVPYEALTFLDTKGFWANIKKQRDEKDKATQEAKERAEFEKLKAKYGN